MENMTLQQAQKIVDKFDISNKKIQFDFEKEKLKRDKKNETVLEKFEKIKDRIRVINVKLNWERGVVDEALIKKYFPKIKHTTVSKRMLRAVQKAGYSSDTLQKMDNERTKRFNTLKKNTVNGPEKLETEQSEIWNNYIVKINSTEKDMVNKVNNKIRELKEKLNYNVALDIITETKRKEYYDLIPIHIMTGGKAKRITYEDAKEMQRKK